MPYTLAAAAKAAGRDKTTVLRAIKAGKLSGVRDPVTGGWMVEPAELHRFYGTAALATADATAQRGDATARHGDATAELRARLVDKDALIAELRETVADLRQQRDRDAEERRRLTALLADRTSPPPAATPPRRAWWRWGRQ
jgi:hypothetical protein